MIQNLDSTKPGAGQSLHETQCGSSCELGDPAGRHMEPPFLALANAWSRFGRRDPHAADPADEARIVEPTTGRSRPARAQRDRSEPPRGRRRETV